VNEIPTSICPFCRAGIAGVKKAEDKHQPKTSMEIKAPGEGLVYSFDNATASQLSQECVSWRQCLSWAK